MFLQTIKINDQLSVAEIVALDYRTARIFRNHGIGYCCGGKWPLAVACEMQGVDPQQIQEELELATRSSQMPGYLAYHEWEIDFLVDYLVNIHHHYLKQAIPVTQKMLEEFVEEHKKKFTYLEKVESDFKLLSRQLLVSEKAEEEILFPYLRQIAHAYRHKEPYAAIFVRTMRKPVEEIMHKGHEMIKGFILSIRQHTNQYTPPEKACTSHKVVLNLLKELDNDLVQHLYLEHSVLFPKAMAIEKELLNT